MKKLHKNIKIQDSYVSVRVWDRKTRRYYWLDYDIDSYGDPTGEWNQYIFYTDCSDDIVRRESDKRMKTLWNMRITMLLIY